VNEKSEKKITVEDLLRLKRGERPAAQFWERFDAEIRAKQLSAIVIRRPWWSEFAAAGRALRRHQSLVGAAAAVAFALAAYRFSESRPVHRLVPASAPVTAAPKAVVPAPAAQATAQAELAVVGGGSPSASAQVPIVTAEAPHITQAPAAVAFKQSPRSPFSDGIAVTLADFREPIAESSKSPFGSDRDFEAAIAPSHAQGSDPLARMDPAAERRARLLSPGLPTSAARAFASDWMRQRASTNDRMYESMDHEGSDDRSLVGFRF
jgi:hypothetical protein